MSGKLIMNKGLPRSGKSTWAREFMKNSGNVVIVSKDELRKMLHLGKWSHRNEKLTMSAQMAIVKDQLSKGMVVIVDDTNLTPHHLARWEGTAKEMDAGFEVHHEKEADIGVLINRDRHSSEQRGEHVILRLALENGYVHFPEKKVVICDLDGTLCDIEHRRHFVQDGQKDWKHFFGEMMHDSVVERVAVDLHEYVKNGYTLIFVSARPEEYRDVTEAWLSKNGFIHKYHPLAPEVQKTQYFCLLMRQNNDTRDDVIVKQEILDRQLDKKSIKLVYDDRPSVIRMWKRNGLDVIDCGYGIEF